MRKLVSVCRHWPVRLRSSQSLSKIRTTWIASGKPVTCAAVCWGHRSIARAMDFAAPSAALEDLTADFPEAYPTTNLAQF